MKYNKSPWGYFLLFILFSTTSYGQHPTGELVNKSIILRSDFPSKSVVVTNIADYGMGDFSPLLIAGSWTDKGKNLECRSLLEFNYTTLPEILINDPSLLHSAELILYPVNTSDPANDLKKRGKFIVKRVIEKWEDSLIVWDNQPLTDSSLQVTIDIKVKNKKNPVAIDVTKLVKDMLRLGNKGFMICPENSREPSIASAELFASPKNENEKLRPILVIDYKYLAGSSVTQPLNSGGGRAQQLRLQQNPPNRTQKSNQVNN